MVDRHLYEKYIKIHEKTKKDIDKMHIQAVRL